MACKEWKYHWDIPDKTQLSTANTNIGTIRKINMPICINIPKPPKDYLVII